MAQFSKLPQNQQRNILGQVMYQKIIKLRPGDQSKASKITGMLIDFEVFTLEEILDILKNDQEIAERVGEAEKLIENSTNQSN